MVFGVEVMRGEEEKSYLSKCLKFHLKSLPPVGPCIHDKIIKLLLTLVFIGIIYHNWHR